MDMNTPLTSLAVMQDAPVIPVIVLHDVAHAVPLARALVAGGIRMLEVTLRTPVALPPEKDSWVKRLQVRIDGVQQVKESKYIMLHAPRTALPAIRALLPGSEYPTIIPLEGPGDKVAVHAVCRENVFWETLEALKAAGASAVLVLPVEKMLA